MSVKINNRFVFPDEFGLQNVNTKKPGIRKHGKFFLKLLTIFKKVFQLGDKAPNKDVRLNKNSAIKFINHNQAAFQAVLQNENALNEKLTSRTPISAIRRILNDYLTAKTAKVAETANLKTSQPEIVGNQWGSITISTNGSEKTFKDAVILPEEAKEWNWKAVDPAMRHHPGIRLKDVQSLVLDHIKPDVIILSQGRGNGGKLDNDGPGILEVEGDVKSQLESLGIEVYILKTAAAIDKYNQLRDEGKKQTAALIHTTC